MPLRTWIGKEPVQITTQVSPTVEYWKLIVYGGGADTAVPAGVTWRLIAIHVVDAAPADTHFIRINRTVPGIGTRPIWFYGFNSANLSLANGVDSSATGNNRTGPLPDIQLNQYDTITISATMGQALIWVYERSLT